MFEDLRELVRAELYREVRKARYAARMGRTTIKEGEAIVTQLETDADALIVFINELETPPEP